MSRPLTFLCLASFFKGTDLLDELRRQDCRVVLVCREKIRQKFPPEAAHETFTMPDLWNRDQVFRAVSWLCREREFDRLLPLDDYDVEMAAALREHLRLPGMGETRARSFRDKLAMRTGARAAGIPVPRFVHVLNHTRVQRFMEEVPPPWVLKPRREAGAVGIEKLHSPQEAWERIHALGDEQSYQLLEEFLPGDVFHVDSIVWQGEVVFSSAQRYLTPPLRLWNEGGVFATRTVPDSDPVHGPLIDLNRQVLQGLGMDRGVTHAEYIRDTAGRLYFLEIAARVGGAHVHDLVEAARGVNLWREWARLEIATARRAAYRLPQGMRNDSAGLLLCLARQEHPDLSAYTDPEVVWKMNHKPHHAGLIVASPDPARVEELMEDYRQRFERDFLAVAPPAASHLDYE